MLQSHNNSISSNNELAICSNDLVSHNRVKSRLGLRLASYNYSKLESHNNEFTGGNN